MSARDPILAVPTRAIRFLGSFPDRPPPGRLPEIAFAGRSNVGKSSALNALVGSRGAARVSKTPGRTQAINLFEVEGRLCFADLPGYGYAAVPGEVQDAWKQSIERYLRERETLRLVVCLVDARLPAQERDRQLLDGLAALGLPRLILATKVDKLTRNERASNLRALTRDLGLEPAVLLPFSSHTKLGVAEAWRRFEQALRAQ